MMIPEREAKANKICPFLLAAAAMVAATGNTSLSLHELARCRGSECMMWERLHDRVDDGCCGLTRG